ncbi:PD40 domain-containing protein [Psychrobacter sp. GP33]|uniref:PD40 domain-containing protein n=1 Tax=Psychrobacter sp. GP33 TaxID=2758709 RepID=UPI0015FCB532|nr:PD40 domain-containing protein [Psychrobacter sp. GP33]
MMITTVYKGAIITALMGTLSVLNACSTLPTQNSNNTSNMIVNPLTATMSEIDRQGRIAYVEEQGLGAAKISSLYIIRPDGSERQLIDQLNGYIYAPAWSADGKQLTYSKQAQRQPPKIYVYDTLTHAQTLVIGGKGSHLSATFSPDGQKLLYSSTASGNADIYELRLSDGSSSQLTTVPSTEVQPSYAPDGQSFVYVSDKSRAGRPRIYRYNFATKKSQLIATSGYATSPQLSLDGQRMAYLNGRQAAVMTLATGQVINLAETGLDEPARLSPSGSYAVYPMQNTQHSGQKGSSLVIRALSGGASYTISSKSGGLARSPVWGR